MSCNLNADFEEWYDEFENYLFNTGFKYTSTEQFEAIKRASKTLYKAGRNAYSAFLEYAGIEPHGDA